MNNRNRGLGKWAGISSQEGKFDKMSMGVPKPVYISVKW